MSASDQLSALDNSFLDLEDSSSQPAHMHVAAVMVLEGDAPPHEEVIEALEPRLHLVPRYRQKLASAPGGLARPRWVDDPHLNLRYHVRSTALPSPGSEHQLRALAGRVFSQRLDRDKPLWEMWIAEGLEGGRFAILSKTHHALVDGVSGVDIISVLFDLEREPAGRAVVDSWLPRPEPTAAQLAADAVVERVSEPFRVFRSVAGLARRPSEAAAGAREALGGVGELLGARYLRGAPDSPYNKPIGPHRRFSWVRASLSDVKAIKNSLGGTVNDVVLATVTGALRRHMARRGERTDGVALRAMVPVSVRTDDERGTLGNRVTTMYCDLPVGLSKAIDRLAVVSEAMSRLKESRQAVGAQAMIDMAAFGPPNLLAQATRGFTSPRMFNVTVTNVPGPQFPVYLHGRELIEPFPMVPLAPDHGLGVAIMSYNGRLNFGLVGDYEVMYDLDQLAEDFEDALAELASIAGVATGRGHEVAQSGPV